MVGLEQIERNLLMSLSLQKELFEIGFGNIEEMEVESSKRENYVYLATDHNTSFPAAAAGSFDEFSFLVGVSIDKSEKFRRIDMIHGFYTSPFNILPADNESIHKVFCRSNGIFPKVDVMVSSLIEEQNRLLKRYSAARSVYVLLRNAGKQFRNNQRRP